MRISEHTLSEHLHLLRPLLLFVLAVVLLRLLLDAIGAPLWLVKIVSVNVSVSVAVLVLAFQVHIRGFGSYLSVVVSTMILVVWSEILIVLAILLAVHFGLDNVFAHPEFSIPNDPLHKRHIWGHLTMGIGAGTLVGSAMGCLLLSILRKVMPRPGMEQ